jgi:hypothetical protein
MKRFSLRTLAGLALAAACSCATAQTLTPQHTFSGELLKPASYGPVVYMPTGASIEIWDFSDEAHPARTHFEPDPPIAGAIGAVSVVGSVLEVETYDINDETSRLRAYSLTNPTRPQFIAENAIDFGQPLLANGHYLYRLLFDVLQVVDVADPRHPHVVDSVESFAPYAIASSIGGNRFYATYYDTAFYAHTQIVDVSDPAHPVVVGTFGTNNNERISIALDSGYAIGSSFDLSFDDVLTVYDARDPANVPLVGTLPLAGSDRLALRGDDVYAFGGNTLDVFDVSVPAQPLPVGSASIDTTGDTTITDIGGTFVVTTATERALVIDLPSATAPHLRSTFAGPGIDSPEFAADDRYIYFGVADRLLEIVDKDSMTTVARVDADPGHDNNNHGTQQVAVDGDTAFARRIDGIVSIDVTTPSNPRVLQTLDMPTYYNGILADQGRVYVTTSAPATVALTVIDASRPNRLFVAGSLPGFFFVRAVSQYRVFADEYTLPDEHFIGVRIIDTLDETRPHVIGTYMPCLGSEPTAMGVGANGRVLALACFDSGIEFVDVHDPLHPTLVGTLPPIVPHALTTSIVARGSRFYFGTDGFGINEVDAANPAAPHSVASYPIAAGAYRLAISENGSVVSSSDAAGWYTFACASLDAPGVLACDDDGETTPPPPRRPRGHSHHARPR